MDFTRPYFLILPLTLGPLAMVGRWLQHRKQQDWRALGQSGEPQRARVIILSAAIMCFMIALAGPRWSSISSPRSWSGSEVVILVDVSRSMAAEDAIPNRLGAAVLSAETLVKGLGSTSGGRVAVVEFAGRGVLKCPMTENLGAILETLRSLEIGADGSMGTDLGDGMLRALDAFDDTSTAKSRSIVVLSDGEDHEGTWPDLLDRVKGSGIRIHSVLIGDETQGAPIPIVKAGRVERLRHDGEIVRSRSNETSLKAFRDASHGTLVTMGRSPVDLKGLLNDPDDSLTSAPPWRIDRASAQPRYQLFVMAGLILVVMTLRLPNRRFAALAAIVVINVGFRPQDEPIWEMNRSAIQAYEDGDYDRALRLYEQVRSSSPGTPVAHYNVAATLFQMGRYAEARTAYEQAREQSNESLRLKIDFALGNVAVMSDQPEEAIRLYNECLKSRVPGGEVWSIKRDAALNLAYAQTLLPPPPSPDPDGQRKSPRPRTDTDSDGDRPSRPDQTEARPDSEDNPSPKQAGPSGKTPPANPADLDRSRNQTPDEQLRRMLAAVQKGRNARQTDRPPSILQGSEVKDW